MSGNICKVKDTTYAFQSRLRLRRVILYHGLGNFSERRPVVRAIWKYFFETPPLLPVIFSEIQLNTNQITTNLKIIRNADLRQNIKNFKPDLIMLDSSPSSVMLTLLPYKLSIPFVMFGSTAFLQCTRAPILPTVNLSFPYIYQQARQFWGGWGGCVPPNFWSGGDEYLIIPIF